MNDFTTHWPFHPYLDNFDKFQKQRKIVIITYYYIYQQNLVKLRYFSDLKK